MKFVIPDGNRILQAKPVCLGDQAHRAIRQGNPTAIDRMPAVPSPLLQAVFVGAIVVGQCNARRLGQVLCVEGRQGLFRLRPAQLGPDGFKPWRSKPRSKAPYISTRWSTRSSVVLSISRRDARSCADRTARGGAVADAPALVLHPDPATGIEAVEGIGQQVEMLDVAEDGVRGCRRPTRNAGPDPQGPPPAHRLWPTPPGPPSSRPCVPTYPNGGQDAP